MSGIIDKLDYGQLTDYERGFVEGVRLYSWMRDGVTYVGTTGRTLNEALRDFFQGREEAIRPPRRAVADYDPRVDYPERYREGPI